MAIGRELLPSGRCLGFCWLGSSAERGSTVTGGGVVSRRERLALTAGSKLLRLLAMMRWRGGLFSLDPREG